MELMVGEWTGMAHRLLRQEIGDCDFRVGIAVRNGSFILPVQSDEASRLVDTYRRLDTPEEG